MVCEKCHKENRSIAKFCKCQDLLDKLVGLDEVKKQLKTIVDTYTYLRSRKDIANVRISVNAIVIGETGTGKTALAEILRDYFYQHKIIEKPKLTMVDAVDYQRFVDKTNGMTTSRRPRMVFSSLTMCRSYCLINIRIR